MVSKQDTRLTLPDGGLGQSMQVTAGVVALRKAPQPDAEMTSQLLHGEALILHHEVGEFGLVQSRHDRYTGWALMDALSAPVLSPTHKLKALRAYVYSEPSIKASPHYLISMGARLVSEDRREGRFLKCARAGWVIEDQLSVIDDKQSDPAAVAQTYLHTPYLWGARESLGIDCSGLVQQAFAACGVTLPRDSDMQAAWAGSPIAGWQNEGALQRNDLVFWQGHVGIMLDDSRIIHANAYHMAVAIEPLAQAVERIAPLYGQPVSARHIDLQAAAIASPNWQETTDE